MPNISKEKWKTWGNVFDGFTLRTIFKLISQGHFKELKSPLFIGKESNVFSAKTDKGLVVVKIYRLEACDFNRMYDYIKYDPRYSNLKKGKRKIIFSWVQREFRNLMKAREAGVDVPLPITFLNNVIVEEFIGNESAALKLKDSELKSPKDFFSKVIMNMKKMHKAGLIHADLSQFNILNYNENPVFIDFSQCTTSDDPRANELLERDIKNIANFFNKQGLKLETDKIKQKIIGKV